MTTVEDIIRLTKRAGITLEAQGDQLVIDAPAGTLTPELRDQLVRHKPALLARLAPVNEFVSLRGGLTVPRPALELALDLEARGFRMTFDAAEQLHIEPAAGLTDVDRAGIVRWERHLGAILTYEAPTPAWVQ